MSVNLGCSPAYGSGPSRLPCPSACVIGAPVQSSMLRAPQSEPGIWGGMCHPNPPKPGGLGWDTWQDSPLRRNKALPSMIPHRSTKLGTLAQRRGIGGGMVEQTRTHTHTHTHSTGSEIKGKSTFNWCPCGCKCSNSVPLACGEMPDAEGIPLRPKGSANSLITTILY